MQIEYDFCNKIQKIKYFVYSLILISISFFGVQRVNAYFQFTTESTMSFTTATYQNLELATDKTLYGLCNKNATILLTVGNTNAYNMGYTITFSNNSLNYTIDGAQATTYTLPGNGSKTHTIVVSGATQTSTLTITVTPNSPYKSSHTKVINFDLVCPACTWGTLSNVTATQTKTYEITCTDTGSGMTAPILATTNFLSSDTSVAKINSVSNPSQATNGYKYTLTVEGLKAGSFTLAMKAGATKDQTNNQNVLTTSSAASAVRRTPTMTVSSATSSLTYGGSTGSVTYTYSGNGTPYLTNTTPEVATATIDTANKTITITPVTAGTTTITLTAPQTDQYSTISKPITVTVNKRAVTYKASDSSKEYNGSALTNASGCAITSGSLVSGHVATCTNTGTITNKGNATNTLSTVVIKSGTTDVSSNYTITKANGTLTITARAVTYKASDSSKEYDGSALTNASGCAITAGSLVSGHVATCTNTGTITNYGSTTNTLSTVVIKSGTTDVSSNYAITKTNGTLSISKRTVTITAGTTSKTYDGSALTYATCSGNRLVSGQSPTATGSGAFADKNVGTGKTVTCSSITLGSSWTTNYSLSTTSVTTTANITKKTLTPSATASNKTYNGNTTATCAISLSGAVSGEAPTATGSGAFSNATVGTGKTVTCSSIALGSSWTTNYSLSTTSVTTTANITKKTLTPSATASNKTYDAGTSATCAISLSGAVSGEAPTATGSGAFSNATVGTGKTVTCSSIALGSSWTTNYSLSTTSVSTTANITARAVTYKASDSSKEYDGSTLTNASGCAITAGSLVSGHVATCTNTGTITNYGSTTNTLSTVVIKSGTTDVSSNYAITKTNGTLSISKRTVTITAGTTSKTYDGSALTYATCSGNRLVSGQTVTCTMTSSSTITNYTSGGVVNTISTAVIKSGTTDVSGNYTVTTATGKLTITLATPSLTLANKSAGYNGSAIAINAPSVSGVSGGTTPNGTITYTYYSGTSCATALSGAPSAIGTYSAKASMAASGNYGVGTSNCATLTITDTVKPVCVWASGPTPSIISTGSATYVLNCTDNIGLSDYTISSSDLIVTTTGTVSQTISSPTLSSISGGYSYTFTVSATGTGTISLKINTGSVTDARSNTNDISSISNTLTVDNTAPTINYSLASGTYNSNQSVVVSASDTNGSGISYYNVHVYKVELNEVYVSEKSYTGITSPTYTVNLDSPGMWRIYAQAFDNAGNLQNQNPNNGYGWMLYEYIIDQTLPTCSFSNLPSGLEEGTSTTIYLTCTDTNGISTTSLTSSNFIKTPGYTIGSITSTTVTNGYQYNITITGTSHEAGTISLNAGSVSDNAGNGNVATNGSLTIKKTIYLTFNMNGASSYVFNGTTYTSNQTIAVCTLTTSGTCNVTAPTIYRANYTTCGWSLTATMPISVYRPGTTITLSSSGTTLYAITGLKSINFDSKVISSGAGLYNMYNAGFTNMASGKLMYRGANPNNYIYFNCTTEATKSGCTLWRILAIEANDQIELINYTSTTTSAWGSGYFYGSTVQTGAQSFYNSSIKAEPKSHIVQFLYDNKTLKIDSGSTTMNETIALEVNGGTNYYVAIPRVTDYIVSSTNVAPSTNWNGINGSSKKAAVDNWMYDSSKDYFLISKYNSTTPRVQENSNGSVSGDGDVSDSTSKYVKQVLHLNSDVFLLGSGTSGDPYYICPACTSAATSAATCAVVVSNAGTYETSKNVSISYYANGTSASATPYSWSFAPNWTASNTANIAMAGTIRGYIMDSAGATNTCTANIVTRTEYQHQTCSQCKSCYYCTRGVLGGTTCYIDKRGYGELYNECNDANGWWYNGECYNSGASASYGASCGYCGCNSWNTSDTAWYTNSCGTSNYKSCKDKATRVVYAQG